MLGLCYLATICNSIIIEIYGDIIRVSHGFDGCQMLEYIADNKIELFFEKDLQFANSFLDHGWQNAFDELKILFILPINNMGTKS
jgi:hypothetical protein